MKVIALGGQSLTDIAIQVYGSSSSVIKLARDNGLEVTDALMAGTILEYYPEAVADKRIMQYYSDHGITPSTGMTNNAFDNSFDLTFN